MAKFKPAKLYVCDPQIDSSTWCVPSFKLDDNHYVIIWSKSEELQESPNETVMVKTSYVKKGQRVFHDKFGEGEVRIAENDHADVDFGFPLKNKLVKKSTLKVKKPKMIRVKVATPIDRFFFIDGKKVVVFNRDLTIELEQTGDIETLDEIVRACARQDEMWQLLRSDANWRKAPASDKQLAALERNGVDAAGATKGEASSQFDLMKHSDFIVNLFELEDVPMGFTIGT